jgi:transcriptional regulator with XRE-family HTH domain
MRESGHALLPKTKKALADFGENLRLARLRRNLSRKMVIERAGISSGTLSRIEKGEASVAIGAYLQVMFVLGMEEEITKLAHDDVMGRKIQDLHMVTRKRAPKRNLKIKPDEHL